MEGSSYFGRIVKSLVTCDKGSELKIRPVEWCHEALSMEPLMLHKCMTCGYHY